MTLKRKNNSFNEGVVIDLVEKNKVLHKKIRFSFQKLENMQIQIRSQAAILNFAARKFPPACSRGCPPWLCS